MEALRIIEAPLTFAKFIGSQLLGGGWSELPDLSSDKPVRRPTRAAIHYFSTPEIPDNIELGDE